MLVVYFTDCALRFVAAGSEPVEGQTIPESELTRAKVLNFFQSCNTLTVLCRDCQAAFERFSSEFVAVEAAGGVVENDRGEVLMIYRRGRWDLPKGHIDAGEDALTAAVREIEEETAVTGLNFVAPLCNTLHAYGVYGEWEIKRTHWFAFKTACSATAAQAEEDIECAAWCDRATVVKNLENSYPTIRKVIGRFYKLGRGDFEGYFE